MAITQKYKMIDNYMYLYHTNTFIVLPTFTESITDAIQVSFASETPLARSAPIYSYQNSGPRSVRFEFKLHRNMMTEINYGVSNAPVDVVKQMSKNKGADYVDYIIKAVQAAALPEYSTSNKMVSPPVVALRLGNDIFIKGVISGAVNVTYGLPILEGGKYASVTIAFDVLEVTPYQASDVISKGSYRGVSKSLQQITYNDLFGQSSKSKPDFTINSKDYWRNEGTERWIY